MNSLDNLKRVCFLCGEIINDKITNEHIFGNSFLSKFNLKQENFSLLNGDLITYSRLKVPAHQTCNNEFGSQYENKILNLIELPKKLHQKINNESHIPLSITPSNSESAIISTWLSKIYFGLFYCDYLRAKSEDDKTRCFNILSDLNFNLVQDSWKYGHGFTLPSSLYSFWLPKSKSLLQFDMQTTLFPFATIMIKMNELSLILCISDGYLCKNYLSGDVFKRFSKSLNTKITGDGLKIAHLYALSEICALRKNIPKQPKFIVSKENKSILNMSLSTLARNPEIAYAINDEELKNDRKHFLMHFAKSRGLINK